MANTVKAGSWYYRINPNNPKELQRTNVAGQSFSRVCEFNGAEIYDLSAKGDDVIAETSKGRWCLTKSGNIKKM